jgi:hypothetical protein
LQQQALNTFNAKVKNVLKYNLNLHFPIRFHVTTTNNAQRQLYPHCIDYS